MSIELKKRIKSSIKILFIALFIIELPGIIQSIFQCGREFGYNIMEVILGLVLKIKVAQSDVIM